MLVAIVGRKGEGKDTFAAPFIKNQFCHIKMADPLKAMLASLYILADTDNETIQRKLDGDLKEVPCDILQGKTPRHAMQTIGTEWRDMISENLWTEIWKTRVDNLLRQGESVVCTDVRFPWEARAVERLGGYLVRVKRPEVVADDPHPSEAYIDEIMVHRVVYNTDTVEALHQKARNVLKELTK